MKTEITEKTSTGETTYDVFNKLIGERVLFLYDHIDDETATDIVAALFYLDHLDNKTKISLFINSEGGDIRSIFMIYDVMRMIKSPIQTICLGSASYGSSIILAAGRPGMRYATKSSFICLSQLTADGVSYGDMTDARIHLDQMKRDNKRLVDVLSKLTGRAATLVNRDCQRKVFMNPAKAKKYGMIDHVIPWNR